MFYILVRYESLLKIDPFVTLCILDDNGETIVVRGCALDSGTLTTDTEIIRMSHCGGLIFESRYCYGQ